MEKDTDFCFKLIPFNVAKVDFRQTDEKNRKNDFEKIIHISYLLWLKSNKEKKIVVFDHQSVVKKLISQKSKQSKYFQ